MKCFIHIDKEAISVCKKCGKAMCADCSAYSNHSGICPECRREEFIKEKNSKLMELEYLKKAKIGVVFSWIVLPVVLAIALSIMISSLIAVFLIAAVVAIIVAVFKIVNNNKEIGTLKDRVEKLTQEIDRLGKILGKRGGNAFV